MVPTQLRIGPIFSQSARRVVRLAIFDLLRNVDVTYEKYRTHAPKNTTRAHIFGRIEKWIRREATRPSQNKAYQVYLLNWVSKTR